MAKQDHHGDVLSTNYSIMTAKLSAGYEIALGVHISPDKVDTVLHIAELWAGPVICAILSEHNATIANVFKTQAPNVQPVFVPPSAGSDQMCVHIPQHLKCMMWQWGF